VARPALPHFSTFSNCTMLKQEEKEKDEEKNKKKKKNFTEHKIVF
jgi:hypothetical protein